MGSVVASPFDAVVVKRIVMKTNVTLRFKSSIHRVLVASPLLTEGVLSTASLITKAAADVHIFVSAFPMLTKHTVVHFAVASFFKSPICQFPSYCASPFDTDSGR